MDMFFSPMLAHKADQPFDDQRMIAEPKMDGFRLLLSTIDEVNAYTRHGNNVTDRFPELWSLPLPGGLVLDGELIVADPQGRPDLEQVMRRLQTRDPIKIKRRARTQPVQYIIFDLLYYRGQSVMDRPLIERKSLLDEVIEENDVFSRIRYVEEKATGLFRATGEAGLEGIVIKRKDSRYLPGKRSWAWQKVIHWHEAEVVVTGYRKKDPGWLIAVEEDGHLRPGGVMKLGIGPRERRAFYQVAQQIKTKEDRQFVHVEPRIHCRVKYKKWTHAGYLREPVFQCFCL